MCLRSFGPGVQWNVVIWRFGAAKEQNDGCLDGDKFILWVVAGSDKRGGGVSSRRVPSQIGSYVKSIHEERYWAS